MHSVRNNLEGHHKEAQGLRCMARQELFGLGYQPLRMSQDSIQALRRPYGNCSISASTLSELSEYVTELRMATTDVFKPENLRASHNANMSTNPYEPSTHGQCARPREPSRVQSTSRQPLANELTPHTKSPALTPTLNLKSSQ